MSIGFLTRDFSGQFPNLIPAGCAYYRCYLPAYVSGHNTRIGYPAWDAIKGFGVKETNHHAIFGFNTVILKLLMDRWVPRQIELAQALGQRVIVDIDDHYEGLTPANAAYQLTHPDENKKTNRDIYREVIYKADAVTVSTPFLYDLWSQRRDNVTMIRNGVNMEQFNPVTHTTRKPVLGWAGATNYRNNDLEQLREWLPNFLNENDLRFHHAGHDNNAPSFAEVTGVDPHRITTSPLVPITRYANGLQFDIGIVPLSDIPFNHAKSNIKGLEYAAAGIPFVASDLPEYRLLHESGVGRLARTPSEWVTQISGLLDHRQRKRESAWARQVVDQDWAIESRTGEWRAVFAS